MTTHSIKKAAADVRQAIIARNEVVGDPLAFNEAVERSNQAFDRMVSQPSNTAADLAEKVRAAHAHYPGFLMETDLSWVWDDVERLAGKGA